MGVTRFELQALQKLVSDAKEGVSDHIHYCKDEQLLMSTNGWILGVITHKVDFDINNLSFVNLDPDKVTLALAKQKVGNASRYDTFEVEDLVEDTSKDEPKPDMTPLLVHLIKKTIGYIIKEPFADFSYHGMAVNLNELTAALNFVKQAVNKKNLWPMFTQVICDGAIAPVIYHYKLIDDSPKQYRGVFAAVGGLNVSTSCFTFFDGKPQPKDALRYQADTSQNQD